VLGALVVAVFNSKWGFPYQTFKKRQILHGMCEFRRYRYEQHGDEHICEGYEEKQIAV
jgi:hypothetical protein